MIEQLPVVKALAAMLVALTDTQRAIAALVTTAVMAGGFGLYLGTLRSIPDDVKALAAVNDRQDSVEAVIQREVMQNTLAMQRNTTTVQSIALQLNSLARADSSILAAHARLECLIMLDPEGMSAIEIDNACRAREE